MSGRCLRQNGDDRGCGRRSPETFLMFAIVQLLTVLVLVPPLFGGHDRRRKTAKDAALPDGQPALERRDRGRQGARSPAALGGLLAMGLPIVSIHGLDSAAFRRSW